MIGSPAELRPDRPLSDLPAPGFTIPFESMGTDQRRELRDTAWRSAATPRTLPGAEDSCPRGADSKDVWSRRSARAKHSATREGFAPAVVRAVRNASYVERAVLFPATIARTAAVRAASLSRGGSRCSAPC
jgi:hypothetical protein